LKQAFKELGYRNVDKLIEQLKEEMADPALMTIRAKMWQLSSGILMAQKSKKKPNNCWLPVMSLPNMPIKIKNERVVYFLH
jgi:hypothetical protein